MTRQPERNFLPLLPRREERGGERRGIFARVSPLPSPLPARPSRGEGEDLLSPPRLIQWQWRLSGLRNYPTIGSALADRPPAWIGEAPRRFSASTGRPSRRTDGPARTKGQAVRGRQSAA